MEANTNTEAHEEAIKLFSITESSEARILCEKLSSHPPLSQNVFRAWRTLRDAEVELDRLADAVIRRAQDVKNRLANHYHVNELGELQSTGRDFERLCAKRQMAIESLNQAIYLAENL